MTPAEKKAVGDPPLLDPQQGADAEFIAALLAAYGELELADLLQALLDPAVRWCGSSSGFALGAVGERRAFIPLARTVGDDDPRADAFKRVDPEKLKRWLPDGPATLRGFGPFQAIVDGWPGEPPPFVVAIPVTSPAPVWGGVLLLAHDDEPDGGAVARTGHLVRMAAPAVAHALQVLSMRELVIKDDTASCFNRRYFEEFLPEELSRASRFRSPVSLIFLDMDNLKEVNSRHGHSAGSRTLWEVSVRIRSRIRKFDKLFRFGGDEFCIVLPETEWHGALEVAERVRTAISSKPFLVRELGADQAVSMTASLGIASYPLHARARQELIQQADRAMQKIKRAKKDGIGIAEMPGGDDGS